MVSSGKIEDKTIVRVRQEPPRTNLEGKEARVVREKAKIRDKGGVTVLFSCPCVVNVAFKGDGEFDDVDFSVRQKQHEIGSL